MKSKVIWMSLSLLTIMLVSVKVHAGSPQPSDILKTYATLSTQTAESACRSINVSNSYLMNSAISSFKLHNYMDAKVSFEEFAKIVSKCAVGTSLSKIRGRISLNQAYNLVGYSLAYAAIIAKKRNIATDKDVTSAKNALILLSQNESQNASLIQTLESLNLAK